MRALPLLVATALLGLLLACRKGDGTTPTPSGPIKPSATASK